MKQANEILFEVKTQFERRCKKNPSYSLRSYARSLGISPATLSGLLNGRRQLTTNMLEKIGTALGVKTEKILRGQRELLGLKLDHTRKNFNMLSQDVFAVVSDWYHLTILELMKLEDFRPDPKWIAQKINVNEIQIKIALERLQRVGLLEIINNKWIDRASGYTTHYNKAKTSSAKRRYQLQLLEKSKQSLLKDDFSIRDHSSITMAIDPKDISLAKEEIAAFRKRLSFLLEKNENLKDVYQIQISLFPLTEQRNKK